MGTPIGPNLMKVILVSVVSHSRRRGIVRVKFEIVATVQFTLVMVMVLAPVDLAMQLLELLFSFSHVVRLVDC